MLCRTDPDVADGHEGLSPIVVPTDTKDFEAEPIDKMGLMGNDHAHITYDDVRVPTDNLLGEEGQGFNQVLDWLNEGHGRIAVSAAILGQVQGALDRAREYATRRAQGGQPIKDYRDEMEIRRYEDQN